MTFEITRTRNREQEVKYINLKLEKDVYIDFIQTLEKLNEGKRKRKENEINQTKLINEIVRNWLNAFYIYDEC